MAKKTTENTNHVDMNNAHKEFRDVVDQCAEGSLDRWIPNSATTHAAYLLYKLLESAAKRKSHVRIISGQLDKRVYNQPQMLDALDKCIHAQVKMDVAVLEEVDGDSDNKFHERLKAYVNAQCYELSKDASADNVPHMLVVGEKGLRYETNTKTHAAYANFNDTDFVKVLNQYFEQLIEDGTLSRIAA